MPEFQRLVDRKAPPGKLRVVATDSHQGNHEWLIGDADSPEGAKRLMRECENPDRILSVHNDQGQAIKNL